MPKFRKKPVVIEAVQWEGHKSMDAIKELGAADWCYVDLDQPQIHIVTLEGEMVGEVGDWIIKDIQGEFYPCKPDIFEAIYEPIEAQDGE